VAIADGWFPQVDPSGAWLACGSLTISVASLTVNADHSVTVTQVADLGPGQAPAWYNPGVSTMLLWYDRAATLKVAQPAVWVAANLTGQAFNAYGAGGGAWAGWVAPGQMRFSDGTTASGRLPVPAGPVVDQGGRSVYLTTAQNAVILKGSGSIAGAGTFDTPHIAQQAIVWQKYVSASRRETFGRRGAGGIERVQASADTEFWSVPIDTPIGPYILSHDSNQLFLRKWNDTAVTIVAVGVTDFPHGVFSTAAQGFVIAWSDGGALGVRFIPADLGAVIPVEPDAGGGVGTGPDPGTTPAAGGLTVPDRRLFIPVAKPVYPHVDQIDHYPTQQTIRLLWDQMFRVNDRLDRGDIHAGFAAASAALDATNATLAAQATQIAGDPAESRTTSIGGGGSTGGDGGGGGGGGGGGTSLSCADSPGTGHFDPGGELTEDRARKIACGTGDEWSVLRAPTANLADRETNAEQLTLRIIWHLAQGGYTVGRQRNPSTAISKDKIALVVGTETLAIDLYASFDAYTSTLRTQWVHVTPADLVADAGIPD
jgi:uncharacterized membrane protein YgcG